MTQNQNYQQHIERAIQNVLTKVRHPGRSTASVEPSALTPTRVRPAPRRHVPEVSESTASYPTVEMAFPQRTPRQARQREEQITAQNEVITSEIASPDFTSESLLEGEDLYTPLLIEENPPEEQMDAPLQEDDYIPPYNLFEEFVETELNILLARYLDLCRCGQCRSDIVALSLQQLPAYYVTGTRGTLTAKSVVWTRYMQQVMDAVNKSIHIVYKRPRSSCRRIKQVLWVKPELEEVSTQQLFEQVYQADLQLDFSPEVSDIIQTLEASESEDKHELLPVSSPWIQEAYQKYKPEIPETPHQINHDALPSEGSASVLQLLDIDDAWGEDKMEEMQS